MYLHTYTYIQPDEEKNEKERDRRLLLRMYAQSHHGDEGSMNSFIMLSGKREAMIINVEGGKRNGKVSVEFISDGMSPAACSCSGPLRKGFPESRLRSKR